MPANTTSLKHILWLVPNSALAFALPYMLLYRYRISLNLYCIVLAAAVMAAAWCYTRATRINWGASLKPSWALGSIFGVFFGLSFISVTSASKPDIHALFSNFTTIESLLQGPFYGLAISLLISVLPFVITWRSLAGASPGSLRKVVVTLAAVLSILSITTLYNIGMPDSNGTPGERIRRSLAASVPTIISGNPLASTISHMFLQASLPVILSSHKDAEMAGKSQETKSKTSPGGVN